MIGCGGMLCIGITASYLSPSDASRIFCSRERGACSAVAVSTGIALVCSNEVRRETLELATLRCRLDHCGVTSWCRFFTSTPPLLPPSATLAMLGIVAGYACPLDMFPLPGTSTHDVRTWLESRTLDRPRGLGNGTARSFSVSLGWRKFSRQWK